MCQEILQYYWNIGNISNTDIDWFVLDKILLVPALTARYNRVHDPTVTSKAFGGILVFYLH